MANKKIAFLQQRLVSLVSLMPVFVGNNEKLSDALHVDDHRVEEDYYSVSSFALEVPKGHQVIEPLTTKVAKDVLPLEST